jgi:hypothetical protein
MRVQPLRLALPALVLALAGCGETSSPNSPDISRLPLVVGAHVVAVVKQCDRGANGFCSVTAVIVDRRFTSSGALVASERRYLSRLGWTYSAGDNGDERAAESPGHKLRVTYATAAGDLAGIDEGWIKRPQSIALALDRQFIDGTPTMSVMIEAGSA